MSEEEKIRVIEVVPYDPKWAEAYREEAAVIAGVLKDEMLEIHHMGSTSIPGIYAKPIIDIMLVVKDILRIDGYNEAMGKIGYVGWGEYGIPGRRYFFKGPIQRTHQIHTYQAGNPEITRHLNFRDYLRAHPAEAEEYGKLKLDLARQFRHDINAYTDGKDDFIHERDRRATEWVLRGSGIG